MIGQHLLADLYDVASDRLVDAGLLADCLGAAARRGGMNPIGPPVLHRFEGGGLTGYLLLSESHIALHTYPEHRYLALDIFSCGRADSEAALSIFLAALEPGRQQITTAPRGAEISRPAIEGLGFGPHRVACDDQDRADGIRRSTHS